MEGNPILTICIPSTYDRKEMTDRLVEEIQKQISQEPIGLVELIVDTDNKEVSIGVKRQRMLESGKGLYISMIDSDDWVNGNYVSLLLDAISRKRPDHIGFKIRCSGTKYRVGVVSNKYNDWRESGGIYTRTPYHKSCMKTDIARQIGFKDMRYAEDYDFSKRLKQSGLIKSEVFIPSFLYFYSFKYQDPKIKYGSES